MVRSIVPDSFVISNDWDSTGTVEQSKYICINYLVDSDDHNIMLNLGHANSNKVEEKFLIGHESPHASGTIQLLEVSKDGNVNQKQNEPSCSSSSPLKGNNKT